MDCDNPIRLWLKVIIGVLGFHCIFLVLGGMLGEKISGTIIAINTVTLSFMFLWMLLGGVWILHDTDCHEEFPEGYYLVNAIIALYFGVIGITLLMLLGVVCLVCVGAIYINQMIDTDKE